MALISANFCRLLSERFREKSFGLVNRKKQSFVRDYHRELKNGKGLDFMEARSALLDEIKLCDLFR